jgi:hypothetical protein
MRSLTWSEVFGRRLERHFLDAAAAPERLVEVVGAVCGIHAQLMPSAELSIGLRVAGVTRREVREQLWERRSLVKTVGMRGTLHLFPTGELPLWLAALRASPSPNRDRDLKIMGIDAARMDTMVAAIGEALDGRRLARDQLGDEVVRRVGSWAAAATFPAFGGMWPRWRLAISAATAAGVICFGPSQGNRVTFVRLDQWAGAAAAAEVDGAGALAEVLRRYLRAYGPATHLEFAQWFNMPPAAAGELLRSLGGELEEVDVEGRRAWLPAAEAAAPWRPARGSLRLLPHFDCYAVGCHPRDRLIPLPAQAAAVARGLRRADLARPVPALLLDGTVAGVWERRRSGRRLELRVEPYQPLGARQRRQLEAQAARVGEILEASATLALGTVDARPHL